jgi:hypothetical protein
MKFMNTMLKRSFTCHDNHSFNSFSSIGKGRVKVVKVYNKLILKEN